MQIRETSPSDLNDVLSVEKAAFGGNEEAELVEALLNDPSAEPRLSLLAFEGDRAVGHILFTAVGLANVEDAPLATILAPLAVAPEAQNRGIGARLIDEGARRLEAAGVELVFVLGHPAYYQRHSFRPAGALGFEAPYPIAAEHAEAWMVRALGRDEIDAIRTKIICADALDEPKYWTE